MLGFLNRFKTLLLVAGFLLLPVALLYVQRRIPAVREVTTGFVVDSSRIFQEAIVSWFGDLSDYSNRYFNALDSYDELQKLQRNVRQMRSLKVALFESEAENKRLKRLLHFSLSFEGPAIVGARIIGRTGSPLSRTIQIDRGRYDGVKRGDGVVSTEGVVGQVIAAGLHASEVLLATDSTSAIDVVIQRSRALGILRGSSTEQRYWMRVNDFDRLHEVQIGDLVVTSGLGSRFPVGTPVGRVSGTRVSSSGLYMEAEIKPDAELGRMEEVLILTEGASKKAWRYLSRATILLEQCVAP